MSKQRYERYREAYLTMAKEARYRPAAPSDGFGNINLTVEELADPTRLEAEAETYAGRFYNDDDKMQHWTGCSNFRTNRALVFVIEAARCLCGAEDDVTARLLRLALAELEAVKRE